MQVLGTSGMAHLQYLCGWEESGQHLIQRGLGYLRGSSWQLLGVREGGCVTRAQGLPLWHCLHRVPAAPRMG